MQSRQPIIRGPSSYSSGEIKGPNSEEDELRKADRLVEMMMKSLINDYTKTLEAEYMVDDPGNGDDGHSRSRVTAEIRNKIRSLQAKIDHLNLVIDKKNEVIIRLSSDDPYASDIDDEEAFNQGYSAIGDQSVNFNNIDGYFAASVSIENQGEVDDFSGHDMFAGMDNKSNQQQHLDSREEQNKKTKSQSKTVEEAEKIKEIMKGMKISLNMENTNPSQRVSKAFGLM